MAGVVEEAEKAINYSRSSEAKRWPRRVVCKHENVAIPATDNDVCIALAVESKVDVLGAIITRMTWLNQNDEDDDDDKGRALSHKDWATKLQLLSE